MNPPLISIVIVTFNAGSTLQSAIDSVLSQTYKHTELVIIDGDSKDNTLEIIKKNSARLGYFISEKDKGVYDAMNKAIDAAKGDWILFLGADDTLYNDKVLSDIFAGRDIEEVDLLYGDVEFTTNKKRYGAEKDYLRLVERNICHQAMFHHRRIFEKLGKFSMRYPVLADFEMNIRIFHDETISKKYIPIIITFFNNTGMSSSVLDRFFHADMLKKFLEEDKMPFLAPQLQQYHFYHGLISLFSGKPGIALRQIPASWISGKRKLFYFLFGIKFLLRTLIRDKIIIKPGEPK